MSLAPKRSDGPLGQLQKEGDVLKTKIDEITGISSKWSPKSASDSEVVGAHKKCVTFKIEASSLLLRANSLQQHEEPDVITNFNQKKSDEIERLVLFQSRLGRLINSMEELEEGDELRSTRISLLGENSPQTDDVGDEDLSEDEDDSLGYEEDEEDVEENDNFFVVIHPFAKQEEGDMSLRVGDVLEIVEKTESGWWKARDEDGLEGLVPSNHLKLYEDEDDEEEDKEDQVEMTDVPPLKTDSAARGSPDHQMEEPVQSAAGESDTGKSPRSLQYWTYPMEWDSMDSGKVLWKGVKDVVIEPHKTDVTDVLAAMGALPAGFRPSTLHAKLAKGTDHRLSNAILPKLSQSRLSFDDLHLDPATSQIRKIVTRVLRTCRVIRCRMIPTPGTGVEVLSHHVRLCLFDGSKILSNIETVRATIDPTKPKLWNFSTRSATKVASGMAGSLADGLIVVRTGTSHSNVGVLFELGVTYIRNPPRRMVRFSDGLACEYSSESEEEEEGEEKGASPPPQQASTSRHRLRQTGERGELSCGWIHLKLFDEQGNPIANKSYDVPLNGGTPYEQGVDVDPSIMRRASSNRFKALIAGNKQPTITVQFGTPSVEKRKYLELLPETIVIRSRFAELTAFHRRVLADALVRDRLAPMDADLVHSPVISAFVAAIDQPDLVEAMQQAWEEKKRPLTRADKRDKENVKNIFKSVVMETAYPLLHLTGLPEAKWADAQSDMTRAQVIQTTLQVTKQQSGVLRHLLAPSGDVEPFDVSEVTFDPIRGHGRSLW